jgi:hypothetical protein
MTNRKRNALTAWIWATWLPGLLLAGGFVLAGCAKDPIEPEPVKPEFTFSVTFADGDFKAAFQISEGGGYVAAGTGADGQGFIYKIEPNGTEATRYVFDQNASGEYVEDALPVDDGGYMVCGHTDDEGWVAKVGSRLETVKSTYHPGSNREDHLQAMVARSDGGFVLGGEYDWDRSSSTGDGWLVKVSSSGAYEGQASFGGAARDHVLALTPAGDGGFFFGGATYPSAAADVRAWVCKTNAAADALVWNKSYIYTHSTALQGLVATSDGGCICVGGTTRMETASYGASDAYILRVDANGDHLWSKNSGIDGPDRFYSIAPAHDGGYVCAGVRYDTGSGWLVKIDDNGNIQWEKTFAGGVLNSIKQTSGSGYVCSGRKDNKAWLLRVDINGDFKQ